MYIRIANTIYLYRLWKTETFHFNFNPPLLHNKTTNKINKKKKRKAKENVVHTFKQ